MKHRNASRFLGLVPGALAVLVAACASTSSGAGGHVALHSDSYT